MGLWGGRHCKIGPSGALVTSLIALGASSQTEIPSPTWINASRSSPTLEAFFCRGLGAGSGLILVYDFQ